MLSGENENLVIFELSVAHFQEGAWVENKGIVLAFHHEAWKDKVIYVKQFVSGVDFICCRW